MYKICTYLIVVSVVFITACLDTPLPDQPLNVQLYYEVEELGETFEDGENSIVVDEFKFTIDRFNLMAENDIVLESSDQINSMVFFYTADMTEENLVLSADLGFQDINQFEGYEMFLRPVENAGDIEDQDFYGTEINYSLVIIGEFNGDPFEYKSAPSFDIFQDLGEISVGSDDTILGIDKQIAISDILIEESNGSLIDPRNTENESVINERFKEKINIEGYSQGRD